MNQPAIAGPGLADLHVHSTCSGDGASTIAEYTQRAAELGVYSIGFCEHADFDPRDRSYRSLDPARYDRELGAARSSAPGIEFSQGVEITYQASREDEIRAWLDEQVWDYVVVSVHLVDYADGWAMISEARAVQDYYNTHTERESYRPYFDELWRAACSGLGDVLGHLDLVKRYGAAHYGPFDPGGFEQEIRTVLCAAAAAEMALEINTSGLRQAPGEPYPGLQVLHWFRQEGGRLVTVGSDAHQAADLAAGTEHAVAMAAAAGLSVVTSFHRRHVRGCVDANDL